MAHPETVFGCAFHLQEKLGNENKKFPDTQWQYQYFLTFDVVIFSTSLA